MQSNGSSSVMELRSSDSLPYFVRMTEMNTESSNENDQLLLRVSQLEARLAQLEGGRPNGDHELRISQQEVDASISVRSHHESDSSEFRDGGASLIGRRSMFGALGALAVGAVAANVLQAEPAAAANGDPLTLGQANSASATSTLVVGSGSTTGSATFALAIGAFDGTIQNGLYANVNGVGVSAAGGRLGANFNSSVSHMRLVPSVPITTATANLLRGEVRADVAGDLWYQHSDGTTGARKLAGPGTAGALHVISGSRVLSNTTMANGQTVVVDCSSRVPSGATAVLVTILAFATTSDGYQTCYAEGTANPLTISCYWSAGAQMATAAVVPVSASRRFNMTLTSGGGSVGAAVDISGYYL
jgi:hypothetical protein